MAYRSQKLKNVRKMDHLQVGVLFHHPNFKTMGALLIQQFILNIDHHAFKLTDSHNKIN